MNSDNLIEELDIQLEAYYYFLYKLDQLIRCCHDFRKNSLIRKRLYTQAKIHEIQNIKSQKVREN